MKLDALSNIVGLVTDRDLVFAFFAIFSRFEYALKRTAFVKQKEKAEPDWDRFTRSIYSRMIALNSPRYLAGCIPVPAPGFFV
jgi:hypothetical protein